VPIKFTCPSCGKALRVPEEAAGKRGRCPYCQNSVTVPFLSQPPETEEKIEVEEQEGLRLVKEEILDDVRRCPGCGIIVDKSARTCTRCGTDLLTGQKFIKAATLARPTPEKAKVPPATFWAALPYALAYPFNPKGLVILITGTIFLFILDILSVVPLIGLLVSIFAAGYLATYMFSIIGETGRGEDEPPSWPSFTNLWDDILRPFGRLFAAILVSFGPLFIYMAFSAPQGIATQNTIHWLLLTYGIVCLPMALLSVGIFQSVAGVNPVLIISSILKVPLQYLGAVIFLGLIYYLPQFWGGRIVDLKTFVLIGLLSRFVFLYFLMLEMRILGLIYRYNEEKLNWF